MTDSTSDDTTAAVDAALADLQEQLLDAMNVHYDDSTLLVARVLGDRRAATRARATSVHARGIELVVRDADGEHDVSIPFPQPVGHPDEVLLSVFAIVAAAREASGEDGTTSAERVIAQAAGYRTFLTTVTEVVDLGPDLRQVTFAGGDLARGFAPVGPDTFLYLLLPPPGRDELTIDERFSWEAVREMPPEDQPVGAYYTLRRWRPEVAELDVWMVLHGDAGAASAWAARAEPGDPVALWGPRTSWAPPSDTDSFLLLADETGLPATAVIIDSLPTGTPIRVLAEVADEAHRQPLPERRDGLDVTWLHRAGADPGTTTLLSDAALALGDLSDLGTTPYVWGGAESRAVTQVRRHVRQGLGLGRERVSLVGYWRHRDHADDPEDGDG